MVQTITKTKISGAAGSRFKLWIVIGVCRRLVLGA
jgi:hypothetical protein